MAATLWSKALGRGLYSAARICRCSRSSLGLSMSRYASSATQLKDVPPSYASPLPTPELSAQVDQPSIPSAHADQPKFSTLEGLVSPQTLKALTGYPFKLVHMSPVQAAVLPLLPGLVQNRGPNQGETQGPGNLMVKARTGTGKTLGFLVPAVEHRVKMLRMSAEQATNDGMSKSQIPRVSESFARKNVGALIISPTRELATQIANEALKLTKHHEGFEVRLLVGGLSKGMQMREWHRGRRDIVVATPGRLRDLIENEAGFADDLKSTEVFILDEADTLLDMGFKEDIEGIQQVIKPREERHTFLFSATLPKAVRQVAGTVLPKDHTFINCVPDDAPPTHLQIPQYCITVQHPEEQLPHLFRLIAEDQLLNPGKSKVLVFLATTRLVRLVSTFAQKLGRQVLPTGFGTRFYEMHAQKNMQSRMNTSAGFRRDESGGVVMLTSDVSARGVDYPGVTRVIQVGLPSSAEIYVHRVGRTGRGSNMNGRADLLLLPWEAAFPKSELTEVPIQYLSSVEHAAEIGALAQKYDANPTAAPTPSHRDRGRPHQRGFQADVAQRLDSVKKCIEDFTVNVEEESVQEAMSSLLGFYGSNPLPIKREETIAGVTQWAKALAGRPVHLRIPREFGRDRAPKRRVDYKRQSSSRNYDGRDGGFGGFGGRDGGYGGRSYGGRTGSREVGYGRSRRDSGESTSESAGSHPRSSYSKPSWERRGRSTREESDW